MNLWPGLSNYLQVPFQAEAPGLVIPSSKATQVREQQSEDPACPRVPSTICTFSHQLKGDHIGLVLSSKSWVQLNGQKEAKSLKRCHPF